MVGLGEVEVRLGHCGGHLGLLKGTGLLWLIFG